LDASPETATGESAFRPGERESSVRSRTAGSRERFERARKSLAGGVSSGVRASARPYPIFFREGNGSRAVDVDGNAFVDYGLAWGPLILGQSPPDVVRAISEQVRRGLTFGAQHDLEYEVAERLTGIIPCADSVAFANSGTEIVQVALRLARAATGRQKYLKFEGHYHGWDDSVLVSYHPTAREIDAAKGQPIAAGMGQKPHTTVLVAEWNDAAGVERLFEEHARDLSAVICEPLLCNTGCIPPEPGFLEFLRDITRAHGSLLIFDEVITGFRLKLEGAQGFYGVTPDLATYAKAVGAGTALSVLAGRSEYMDLIASGRVVHAGSLNGNPISLAAARAALDTLSRGNGAVYRDLWQHGESLRTGLEAILRGRGHQVVTSGGGPVFHLSFASKKPRNYREALAANSALYSDFAMALLDEGVLVLPDGRWYVSTAHSAEDIQQTLAAAGRAAA
jgi:glutamate-1-semialdehyde 2,1-aminomutase